MRRGSQVVRIYDRDDGPICYEAFVLRSEGSAGRLVVQLSRGLLKWRWASWERMSGQESSRKPLRERGTTGLAHATANHLANDLLYRDSEGWGLQIVLLGAFEWASSICFKNGALLESLQEDFGRFIQGGAKAPQIVVLFDGIGPELIFVPKHPVDEVGALLQECVLAGREVERLPYEKLGVSRIEYAFRGEEV